MRAIEKKGYVQATPVQAGAIPYFMEWKDVIAKAPTGTGKTFAFGIPIVEHIDPECADVQGLVLAPTREQMCIRDSGNTVRLASHLIFSLFTKFFLSNDFAGGFPFPYFYAIVQMISRFPAQPGGEGEERADMGAVSYTHLDVYKRQLMDQ